MPTPQSELLHLLGDFPDAGASIFEKNYERKKQNENNN
jgi:hypothetical protein